MATFLPETPPPVYSPPPLYESLSQPPLSCQSTRKATLRLSVAAASKLVAVDFFPESSDVRFPLLIERANSWLRTNADWRVQSCESVDLSCLDGASDNASVLCEDHFSRSIHTRGIRLWNVPNRDKTRKPQQIGYVNFIPKRRKYSTKFQLFNEVIEELNADLQTQPLNGKMLSIETVTTKFDDSKPEVEVDADCTYFTPGGGRLYVIRIFYELSKKSYETLEIVDFFPKKVLKNGSKVYESFSNLVAQAAEFCKYSPDVDLVGLQSIEMNKTSGAINRVDSATMTYKEKRAKSGLTKHLQILRLYYTRRLRICALSACRVVPHISCKTFVPRKVEEGRKSEMPTFETTQQTLLRISNWVQENNAHVICAETSKVLYTSNKEPILPSCTYSIKRSHTERYIIIFRLFVEGEFPNTPLPEAGPWLAFQQPTGSENHFIAEVADCIFL